MAAAAILTPSSNQLSCCLSFNSKETWSKEFQAHLAAPLLAAKENQPGNVIFVCRYDERVTWNGLPYLASLSKLFRPRSGEEQKFTVMVPDYSAGLVRKLLLLISLGASVVRQYELEELTQLAKGLGVSCNF